MQRLSGWLLNKEEKGDHFDGNIFNGCDVLKFHLKKAKLNNEEVNLFAKLMPWSCVYLNGLIGKNNFIADSFEVINEAVNEPPFNPLSHDKIDLNVRLDYRYLDLRDKKKRDIFSVRSTILALFREYFNKKGYLELVSPKIVLAGLESNITPFVFDYFGKPACLSKGPQTYKTMLLAAGANKVYEIGPIFRIEKNFTERHVAEFTAIDMDFAFVDSEFEVMEEEERVIKYVLNHARKKCKNEFKEWGIKIKPVTRIPQIESNKAKDLLAKMGKFLSPEDSFDKEAEALLGEYAIKKYDSELLFIYNYPWKDRFFYYQKSDNDAIGSKSFDMLWRGTEVSTFAKKEHRKEILRQQAIEKGLDLSKLENYFKIFDYGMPSYGGGGIGIDRFLQRLFLLSDIREVIQFPRDKERLIP